MGCLLPLLLALCALISFGLESEQAETDDYFVYDYGTDSSATVNEDRNSVKRIIKMIEISESPDPCRYKLCANGGTCEKIANGRFTCHCQEPFIGKTCERVNNYCRAVTCGHGSCIFKPSHPYYECKCRHPYRPPDCRTGVTCMPHPCQNGGTCLTDHNPIRSTFQCSCPIGYTGKFCEVGPFDCYEDDGESYRGNVSVTVDGDECLNWNSYFILQNRRSPYEYASFEGLGPHSFCRNPDKDMQPWCFVKQSRQLSAKYCNVRPCYKEVYPTAALASTSDPTTSFSQCGKPLQRYGTPKIRYGNRAKPGHHPWQVSLQNRSRSSDPFTHRCGGTLLSSCWVLTAAHCVEDEQELQVVLGGVNLQKHEVFDQIIPVEKVIVHEDYITTIYHNDIALLKLKVMDEPLCAKETHFVKVACLSHHLSPSGTECMISGWDITETRFEGTKHLNEARVLLFSHQLCSRRNIHGERMHESMICAGDLDTEVDSCKGDSGGPLMCEHNGTHFVEGVVSWGTRCGEEYKPGVYTNVSKFVSWIINHMNS